MIDNTHRLRIQILRILKGLKIHEFLKGILTVSFKIHKVQIITVTHRREVPTNSLSQTNNA